MNMMKAARIGAREVNGMRGRTPMVRGGGEGDPGMGQGMIVTPPAQPPARVVNPSPAPISRATTPAPATRAKSAVTRSNNQFKRAWNEA